MYQLSYFDWQFCICLQRCLISFLGSIFPILTGCKNSFTIFAGKSCLYIHPCPIDLTAKRSAFSRIFTS